MIRGMTMTVREEGRRVLARTMAGLVMLSAMAHAIPSRAADGPDPVVLSSPSQLPADCVSLGEISEER